MKRALYILLLLTFSPATLHADQCLSFSQEAAEVIRGEVRPGRLLARYCESCGMEEPVPLRVRSVSVERVDREPRPANIGGKSYTRDQIRRGDVPGIPPEQAAFILESIDLANPPAYSLRINGEQVDAAYLYTETSPGRYGNLGTSAGCAPGEPGTIFYVLPERDPAKAHPPRPWFVEVTGRCYDGSCMAERWTVIHEAILLDGRGAGAEPVSRIVPGDVLEVKKLLAQADPVRAEVVFDHDRFLAGDVFYLLDGLGEGFYRLWHYGRIVEEDLTGISFFDRPAGHVNSCRPPSRECWAEAPGPPDQSWWGLVRTADGTTGWLPDARRHVEYVLEPQ